MAFFAVQPLVYLAAWIQLHVRGALYTLSNTIPILTNTNNRIKFTDGYPLITSPCTAIPERLRFKNIGEISFHIFLYQEDCN